MRLLVDGWPTRQNKIGLVILAEVFNHLRPSRSIPEFFPASLAGVQNHVRLCDFAITPKPVGFYARRSRKIELRSGGTTKNAERLNQSEIVVDRVHVPHADPNKITVKASARFGLLADPV